VLGTEQVHPTVLSVSLSAAASKLLSLAKQGGGASIAFRSTSSGVAESNGELAESTTGVVKRSNVTDPVSDAILARLTQLFSKPLGAVGRLAIQQRLKGGKPTLSAFPEFVRRLSILIEDEAEREGFLDEALALAPSKTSDAPAVRQSNPQIDAEAAPKPKRVVYYRGHKIEE